MTIDEYILQHIDDEGDYLKALYRDTHLKLLYPRMASGHLQGRMLKMFVKMIRPHRVLEIGTYSGYSALCLAEGLPEDGMLYTFEINDEQEDFTRPWLEGSEYANKIKLYIGDALQLVPQLGITFDLAFIDGDKRKILKDTGISIEVIDGQEEARMIYNNHIECMADRTGNYIYVDVGGGSTEINLLVDGELQHSLSYNIGTVRMLSGAVREEV